MTQTHDERRARAMLADYQEFVSCVHEGCPTCLAAVRILSQSSSQSDDAAGFVLVPRASVESAEKLRAFAAHVLEDFPDSAPDAFALQDIAEKHGLLIPHEVTEPCGDNCGCYEYGDFPQTCYRRAPFIAAATGGDDA